jgi:acyl-CoA synthetase (AMP-forming)/AMP-acid ligase II
MGDDDDPALLLHTSGTTSRPKLVPLLQRNLLASAESIGRTLALTRDDVCLNIMPLFHIHGLMAATLASLAAGASVSCTPGFNALKFFAWLDEVRPTWYTAVPTMHQAILARAERHRDMLARGRLRLIRSSSASLPAPVMMEMEKTYGVPVIESYGMTEASHQMASNPLPPRARKPGSVGLAAGPEVAILDEDWKELPRGQVGEVSIRGPNVTPGYEANPEANAKSFRDGWFRTGDQGVLDEEGYLRLTGRLKEQINRGGEKFSPLEVDDVLSSHPAVAQALTFAMPHDKLGEEVAAAVVLREGATATERELRQFCASRLAEFKVPRKVVLLTEIPKGATGKLQRIGLAQKLGLGS